MNSDSTALPELDEARIDEIEVSLFETIARERAGERASAERARVKAVRRGRVWMGGAAAAVVAIAAIIAPQLASPGATMADNSAVAPASGPALSGQFTMEELAGGAVDLGAVSGESTASSTADVARVGSDAREIIATATASVDVNDSARAAEAIGEAAVAAGGYIEALSIGGAGTIARDLVVDPATGLTYPAPSGAWVTVRVPADELTDMLAALAETGTVTASQIDRRDVTTEAVDLRARVEALEASVTRLTELMAQSASTADLIAAESALAQRQSELESLRQQLTWIETQVAMSTLSVTLSEPAPAVAADPAGFGDGIAAGWNGLVAALNGVVVALGFLLPWLAVIALVVLVVWGIRRGVRARRIRRTLPDSPESAE